MLLSDGERLTLLRYFGTKIDTAWTQSGTRYTSAIKISHSPEDLRKYLEISLKALKTEYIVGLLITYM